MTPEKLNELYALAKEATPGPWYSDDANHYDPEKPDNSDVSIWSDEGFHSNISFDNTLHNAQYIAAASPDVVTALIDRVRELEKTFEKFIDQAEGLEGAEGYPEGFCSKARAALNKEST